MGILQRDMSSSKQTLDDKFETKLILRVDRRSPSITEVLHDYNPETGLFHSNLIQGTYLPNRNLIQGLFLGEDELVRYFHLMKETPEIGLKGLFTGYEIRENDIENPDLAFDESKLRDISLGITSPR